MATGLHNGLWLKAILVIAAVVGGYFYFRDPPADAIARGMTVDIEGGTIEYEGVTYSAEWGEETSHTGDLRYIGRAYDSNAPFITNDAVVTTGEFSDPAIVEIAPMKNGSTHWQSRKKPKGTLIALHFIPASFEVFEALNFLEQGQTVEFVGREETDSKIEGSNGSLVGLRHDNHRFLLVERVNVRE